ncbi:MAG: shikimate kinase, partial [Lachnospiraceae bacterium]|nr:shikimate kinase [Lachnospiraceae bacterium]
SALLAVHRHLRAGNIALIGFMGSGKSTVGRALSGLFGLAFAETDAMIEEAAGMPIPEIFSRFGEAHFRELESRCIAQAAAMSGAVISCGGGAVLRPENVDALRKNSLLVLLTASPETILARTQADTSRPLLSGKKTAADIENLLAARQSAYENAAGITIDTDGKSVYQICEEIVLSAAGLAG